MDASLQSLPSSSLDVLHFVSVPSRRLPSVHVCFCVHISPFYTDVSHIGLGLTLMTFNLITLVMTLFPNKVHILRYWGLGLSDVFIGGYDLSQCNSGAVRFIFTNQYR